MLIRILHLAPGCSHFLGPPVISHPGNQEICSFFFCFLEVQCAIHCATQPPIPFLLFEPYPVVLKTDS